MFLMVEVSSHLLRILRIWIYCGVLLVFLSDVSGDPVCSPDKYWSASTQQCEDCRLVCRDQNKPSLECKMRCPGFRFPAAPHVPAVLAEPKKMTSSSSSSSSSTTSTTASDFLPYVITAAGAALLLLVVVLVLVTSRLREPIRRVICRSSPPLPPEAFPLTDITVPSDDSQVRFPVPVSDSSSDDVNARMCINEQNGDPCNPSTDDYIKTAHQLDNS